MLFTSEAANPLTLCIPEVVGWGGGGGGGGWVVNKYTSLPLTGLVPNRLKPLGHTLYQLTN